MAVATWKKTVHFTSFWVFVLFCFYFYSVTLLSHYKEVSCSQRTPQAGRWIITDSQTFPTCLSTITSQASSTKIQLQTENSDFWVTTWWGHVLYILAFFVMTMRLVPPTPKPTWAVTASVRDAARTASWERPPWPLHPCSRRRACCPSRAGPGRAGRPRRVAAPAGLAWPLRSGRQRWRPTPERSALPREREARASQSDVGRGWGVWPRRRLVCSILI